MMGKEFFPDPSNPKTMRDKWEYVFNQVGFKDEYKALTGKPIIEGSYSKQKRSIIFSSVLPGDAAFWDIYDIQDAYYQRYNKGQSMTTWQNQSSNEAKKANAVYYYKLALKMEDKESAEKYLKEYVFYGGTKKTFESSMRSMQPLYWMSKADKKKLLEEMTEKEKETYDRAMEFYKELDSIKAISLP